MGNTSSAHSKLLAAIASDDDTFVQSFMLNTEQQERDKLLAAKTVWASKTCIHLCAKEGKHTILAAILGPLVEAVALEIESGSYPGTAAKLLTRLVNKQQKEGRTPFLTACYYGHWRCAKQLLEAGSNVFAVDKDGNSALHLSAIHGHTEVTEQLLALAEHQAITSRLVSIVNLSGFTPLHYAAWMGHVEIASHLLAAGVDQLQASWGEYDRWLIVPVGSTALHVAALQLKPAICMLLLQHHALQLRECLPGDPMPVDPRTRPNRQCQTPYHAAVWRGIEPNCQLALLLNPNVNVQDVFSVQQIDQHRKSGPPTLRVIAAEAVKQRLLQQLTVLGEQHKHNLQIRALQQRLHSHKRLHGLQSQHPHHLPGHSQHGAPGHHVPGHHLQQHWHRHKGRIASSSFSRATVESVAVASGTRAPAATPRLQEQQQQQQQVVADRCPASQRQRSVSAPGAAIALGTSSGAGVSEIEPAAEPAAAADSRVSSKSDGQQHHGGHIKAAAVAGSRQWRGDTDVMTPMLAPGSLVARTGSSRTAAGVTPGRLSYSSSFQRLTDLSSSKLSYSAKVSPVKLLSDAATAATSAEGDHQMARVPSKEFGLLGFTGSRGVSRTASRSSKHSSVHDLSGNAAAAAAAAGGFAGASEGSAVFGASPQHVAQLLKDSGAADPSTLSYRQLAGRSRTGSMSAATSLAGALPGCVSEKLSQCLEGTALASFTGNCGLVVGMTPRFSHHSNRASDDASAHTNEANGAGSMSPRVGGGSTGYSAQTTGLSTPTESVETGIGSNVHQGPVKHSFTESGHSEECGVCLDMPPAVVLAACCHVLCFECARCIAGESVGCRAPLCPFCRMNITGFKLMSLPALHAAAAGSGVLSAAGGSKSASLVGLSPRSSGVSSVSGGGAVDAAVAAVKGVDGHSSTHPLVHVYAEGQERSGVPHVTVAWVQ